MRLLPIDRSSHRALLLLGLLGAAFLWTFMDASWPGGRRTRILASGAEWAATLGLTDLCIFTEARYTRHPSQADYHSPFQDHPGAMEHFPSGSIVPPPRPAASADAKLD